MSWQSAAILGALGYAALCALLCLRRRRRNKRTGLPTPSDACKRRGPEAVP